MDDVRVKMGVKGEGNSSLISEYTSKNKVIKLFVETKNNNEEDKWIVKKIITISSADVRVFNIKNGNDLEEKDGKSRNRRKKNRD